MQQYLNHNAITMQTYSNINMFEEYIVNYHKYNFMEIGFDYYMNQYIKEHSVLIQLIYRRYINE